MTACEAKHITDIQRWITNRIRVKRNILKSCDRVEDVFDDPLPCFIKSKLQKWIHAKIHGESVIWIHGIILSCLCSLIRRTHSCVSRDKIREAAAESMRIVNDFDRLTGIGHEQELAITIYGGETSKCLCQVIQKISPRLDIVVLVDAK